MWGKRCWFVHEEDLMDTDESFKKRRCFAQMLIMRQKFKTKDQTKKHRKSKHIKNTQFCNKYKSNRCPRSDDYCCYRQKETETNPE